MFTPHSVSAQYASKTGAVFPCVLDYTTIVLGFVPTSSPIYLAHAANTRICQNTRSNNKINHTDCLPKPDLERECGITHSLWTAKKRSFGPKQDSSWD